MVMLDMQSVYKENPMSLHIAINIISAYQSDHVIIIDIVIQ